MVPTAKDALGQSGVKVAAVATAFPSGRALMPVKLADTRDAVAAGADEIDMVIDRGAFLSGDYLTVFREIAEVAEACIRKDGSRARLKVIMETGELVTYDNVRRASWLSMLAGGDFIKTSTGKVSPAATLPVTLIMLEAVRDWRDLTGEMVASSRPAASAPARTPSSSSSRSARSPATTGSTRTGSGSARPACSTTSSCNASGWRSAPTPVPTTSPTTRPASTDRARPSNDRASHRSPQQPPAPDGS